MALSFSKEAEEQITQLLPKYPNKMAACLPLLWIAQEDFGWISEDAMRLVAERLELPLTHVYGVATFYTMYDKKPVGHYHVQVCTNISCMINDAYDVMGAFERELQIKRGETTDDGVFTLSEVECLAACGGAVCVQVNKDYHEKVTAGHVPALVRELRAAVETGAAPAPTVASGTIEVKG